MKIRDRQFSYKPMRGQSICGLVNLQISYSPTERIADWSICGNICQKWDGKLRHYLKFGRPQEHKLFRFSV